MRIKSLQALDRRAEGADEGTPGYLAVELDDFSMRLASLHDLVYAMSSPLIEEYFRTEFDKRYPDFKFGLGKKVSKLEEMAEAYQLGPNDKAMRERIHFCLHGCWGTKNTFALNIENTLMAQLGLQYSGAKADSKKILKKHRGGCIKMLIVKKKQILLDNVRRVGRVCYKEILQKKDLMKNKESDENRGGEERQGGVPKIVKNRRATKANDGFDGILTLCEGHEELEETTPDPTMAGVDEGSVRVVSPPGTGISSEEQDLLREFRRYKASSGNDVCPKRFSSIFARIHSEPSRNPDGLNDLMTQPLFEDNENHSREDYVFEEEGMFGDLDLFQADQGYPTGNRYVEAVPNGVPADDQSAANRFCNRNVEAVRNEVPAGGQLAVNPFGNCNVQVVRNEVRADDQSAANPTGNRTVEAVRNGVRADDHSAANLLLHFGVHHQVHL